MTRESFTLQIPATLALQLEQASRALECTPEEYALAALDGHLQQGLNPMEATDVPQSDPYLEQLAETRDLLLAEQISQGTYLAARLDGLELVVRSLLNLELQTDKRGNEPLFQAIHQALIHELSQRSHTL